MDSSVSLISKTADCIRRLIKYYPEAAGIKDGKGKTPYDFTIEKNVSSYIQRLLLRVNPIELHRLNYQQRRMAMFFAFRFVVDSQELKILNRLKVEI